MDDVCSRYFKLRFYVYFIGVPQHIPTQKEKLVITKYFASPDFTSGLLNLLMSWKQASQPGDTQRRDWTAKLLLNFNED